MFTQLIIRYFCLFISVNKCNSNSNIELCHLWIILFLFTWTTFTYNLIESRSLTDFKNYIGWLICESWIYCHHNYLCIRNKLISLVSNSQVLLVGLSIPARRRSVQISSQLLLKLTQANGTHTMKHLCRVSEMKISLICENHQSILENFRHNNRVHNKSAFQPWSINFSRGTVWWMSERKIKH